MLRREGEGGGGVVQAVVVMLIDNSEYKETTMVQRYDEAW